MRGSDAHSTLTYRYISFSHSIGVQGAGDDSKRDPARTRRIRTAHSLLPTAYCQHISLPYCTVARCDCEQVRYRYHVRQDSAINTQVRSRSPHATPRHAIVCREACFGLCTAGATSWMRELLADARRLGPAGRSAETGRVGAAAAPVYCMFRSACVKLRSVDVASSPYRTHVSDALGSSPVRLLPFCTISHYAWMLLCLFD